MAGVGMGGSGLAEAYVMRKIYKEKLDRQKAAAASAKHNDDDDAKIKNSVGGGKPNDAAGGKPNDAAGGKSSSGGGCFFRRFKTHSGGAGARVSDEKYN